MPTEPFTYDRENDEWIDKWGNRFVHAAKYRRLWLFGRKMKNQGKRPTVAEFLLVSAPYRAENNSGGVLHIMEDGNLADSHVQHCYERAISIGDGYGAALALLLMKMTRSQRGRVMKCWYV